MPKHGVDLHPNVYAELDHSLRWYEERANNLGVEFLVEVDRAIDAVRESPTVWSFYDRDRAIRRYLVHRFPYAVVYRITDLTVQIIAVMHLSRHPNYWQSRIDHPIKEGQ